MEATRATVDQHVERAKTLRERGEYANAFRELESASALAPDEPLIRAEIEKVKKACNAEREILGRTNLNCG